MSVANATALSFLLFGFSEKHLVHHYHKNEEKEDIKGEKRCGDMICYKAEEGRHKAAAHVGAGHLHADNCLRLIMAEKHGS